MSLCPLDRVLVHNNRLVKLPLIFGVVLGLVVELFLLFVDDEVDGFVEGVLHPL